MPVFNFVLLGLTGSGKSSTGNSIIGRADDVFSVSDEIQQKSNAAEVKQETTVLSNGDITNVFDTPGFVDTHMHDRVVEAEAAVEAVRRCVDLSPGGIQAFLLVLPYDQRFTQEKVDYIDTLKNIMGNDFLEKHCLLIFTHGDLFDKKLKSGKAKVSSFNDWCNAQTGSLGNVLRECSYRYLLFNNLEPEKNDIEELVRRSKNCLSFTSDTLQSHEQNRHRYLLGFMIEAFTTKTNSEMIKMQETLKVIESQYGLHDQEYYLNEIDNVKVSLDRLLQTIHTWDAGTDLTVNLQSDVTQVMTYCGHVRGLVQQYWWYVLKNALWPLCSIL